MSSHSRRTAAQRRVEVGRRGSARPAPRVLARRAPCPSRKTTSARSPGSQAQPDLQRGAGIEAGARPAARAIAPRARPAGASRPPLRPRNSVRSAVQPVCRPPRSANATRPAKLLVPGVAREAARRSPDRARSRRTARCALRADRAPTRRRRSPRACACGAERFSIDSREILTGSSAATNYEQLERDSVELVLEAAVALAVADDVGPVVRGSAAASGPRSRRSPRRARRRPRPAGR